MRPSDPPAEPQRPLRWTRRPGTAARLRDHREVVAAERAVLRAERLVLEAQRAALRRERLALSADDAEALERCKEAFLAVLSHELRTPINVVMGYASLLADDLAGPVEPLQREYLGRILAGAEALLALVNDLLDMGRIQAGRLNVAAAPVAFDEVAAATLAELRPEAEAKGLALALELPAGLPPVEADEQRLHQVLRILASNAVKFTPAGGQVAVRAAPAPGERLRVEIADTGIGIAPEDLPRLFRNFEQLEGGTTRAHGGAGLGLAIARSLVELHGGAIGAESAVGRGSTFWFELPQSPA